MNNKNPFETKTPENNTADEIVELFVDVFTDFNKILESNHAFLNGPRGSGKSMMFRYMQPDCQMIVKKRESKDLDYFSLYIPIKLTSINVIDLERFANHANIIINEHLLVTHIMSKSFQFIGEKVGDNLNNYTKEINDFYKEVFCYYSNLNDIETTKYDRDVSGKELFYEMANIIEKIHLECRKKCNKLAFKNNYSDFPEFDMSLIDYLDFMLPIFTRMKDIPCFPKDKPFFLLIDDAGYLSKIQTMILNTWVSYRTTADICIKLSTQLDYKTYLTTNGKRIDTPHDYSEINIATIYTSSKNNYRERLKSIVEKRLKYYLGLQIKAEDFFPPDTKQESEIKEIYDKIYKENIDPEKSYAAGDAARRNAVPNYIKFLKEKRSGSTYNYAGFNNLVAISSGIIRHFLSPASEMYLKQENINSQVDYIKDSIQNDVIKEYSQIFLNKEIEKIEKETDNDLDTSTKLFNLIDALGQLFHKILMSNSSDRKVFSIALTDQPDEELKKVLDKGVQLGFLHDSLIGNKEGTGRNKLYVLSRVLSPNYKLDPTSFAGYKFMPSATLKIALTNTKSFLKQVNINTDDQSNTPTLFDQNI